MKKKRPLFKQLPSDRKLVALTAYDYPTARLIEEAGIDIILVGDSLGMVVAGLPDTTGVTMEHMLYHTQMVDRAVSKSLLVSDLPYQSYETPSQAVDNARRLIDAGADAVKLEGVFDQLPQIEAIIGADIPFMGHMGMLPQSILEEGRYKKKGKTEDDARLLIEGTQLLEKVGAGAVVLESIVPDVASAITEAVNIPTIGIGTGPVETCTGQIRVFHDVVGGYPWFVPPFAQPHADIASDIKQAVATYISEIVN